MVRPEVEVEGIVSLKTGGCPEDCHFCSQSGQFSSPVRAAWLDIPSLVRAAVETAATGASEFCVVAAVRGPDRRLMDQVREGVRAIREAVDINVACSLGMLTREQAGELAPDEVPLNFLNPRPGTPLAGRRPVEGAEALKTIATIADLKMPIKALSATLCADRS
ncbi:hypothetical protein [Microbispora oryzae]|uniref:hypothetical protein n=1 Tax=Microbispora oryzae TaxID=2806554 RepID=UPI001E3BBA4A|nr:hypothetical protein [Microbispora oryzae]